MTDRVRAFETILMDAPKANGLPCRIQQLLCQTCEIVLIFHKIPEESTVGINTIFNLYDKKTKRGLIAPFYYLARLGGGWRYAQSKALRQPNARGLRLRAGREF
jgi:hypothetical protein